MTTSVLLLVDREFSKLMDVCRRMTVVIGSLHCPLDILGNKQAPVTADIEHIFYSFRVEKNTGTS